MNLEYFRNFMEIVECGSISAASQKLYISQPALSCQVKKLEETYGSKLLTRNARSVSLTDAGTILYRRIKGILILEDAAGKEIKECIKGQMGTLWLGMSPALPDTIISNLLLNFHKMYPSISMELFEANAEELVDLLVDGIVEIIILRAPENAYPMLESFITITEPIMAIYRRNNAWLSPGPSYVPLTKLKDVPISTSRGFQKYIKEIFEREAIYPNFLCISSSRTATLNWAQQGAAVAIMPTLCTSDYASEELCCLPLGPDPILIKRKFAYLKQRRLSTQAHSFLDFCEMHFPNKT